MKPKALRGAFLLFSKSNLARFVAVWNILKLSAAIYEHNLILAAILFLTFYETFNNNRRCRPAFHKDKLLNVSAVFGAIGTSAKNVSEEKYTEIHVDFPKAFAKQWLLLNKKRQNKGALQCNIE